MWRLWIGFVIVFLLKTLRVIGPEIRPLPIVIRRLLARADTIEVLSLEESAAHPTGEQFLGLDVLGRTKITNGRTRRKLIRRILLANRYNLGSIKCIAGGYGIRAVAEDKTVELALCFLFSHVTFHGPDGECGIGSIGPWPLPLLEKIVKRANIPLPSMNAN